MTADVGEFYEETKRKTARGARAVKDRASAITPETILTLVNQLGLTELVTSRIRARLQQADIDDLIDDVIGYMKRNPEVLVAVLAVTTMAAGLVLFLKSRDEDYEIPRRGFIDDEAVSPGRTPGRKTSRSTR